MINLQEIQARVRELLTKGEVRAVIGYRRGSRGMAAEPVIITQAAAAETLVWDPSCVHNLALYLVEDRKRLARQQETPSKPIAIIAKGCDARAIVTLLQENYFRREDVFIIGISCETTGIVDEHKLERKGIRPDQLANIAFDKDDFILNSGAENQQRRSARELMADRCLECRNPFPKLNNIVFGEEKTRNLAEPFTALSQFEQNGAQAIRWDFWRKQFERCIRCSACRSICPMCYCEECIVDSISYSVLPDTTAEEKANRIRWIERSANRANNIGYHLTRALHLAGRCIDCGECERVCPVRIPLRLLNTKLEREVRTRFGYEPGASVEIASFVSSFRDDDPNDFIR